MAGAETLNDTATEPLVARSDAADRLIAADGPIAELQTACGGEIPGLIAAPDLLELVRKARSFGMRLGRPLAMRHATGKLEGWAEVEPDGNGCTVRLSDWRRTQTPITVPSGDETRFAIESLLAEGVVWLDEGQSVLALESQAADLETLVGRARAMRGEHWTRLFDFSDGDDTPAIWRARSGMLVGVAGSPRQWQLLLIPASVGFRLLLRPIGDIEHDGADADLLPRNLLRDELGPALHDPVRRIIRQAEAIRDRLAGPLPSEYREYAVDIVRAGKHLRELADELGDAEAIEHGTMEIATEPVGLADTIEAACRLLQVQAEARKVTLAPAQTDLIALVDRRRVLQILLNIIGNAIDYGPGNATVRIDAEKLGDFAEIRIDDEGEGLSDEDRLRMFDKFERLGRSGDSGSGLGLYIALMLSRAMGGSVEAQERPGGGNSFVIRLPLA
ncbi:HAMP domain-containing histidine kinase [Croceicoccus ponticola]|uniref:histidine kinase n=1 Tax=Croceicoccus ponticola TaxID=2217664 RepID=A0A437H0E4_9SPHN|nr:HAMP domain-containing sensor histidine kinase [Croceicoccus ponticola]RVQ69059.1 HAMP domain-containing histidine kinase [Croceicoccus ponticola]